MPEMVSPAENAPAKRPDHSGAASEGPIADNGVLGVGEDVDAGREVQVETQGHQLVTHGFSQRCAEVGVAGGTHLEHRRKPRQRLADSLHSTALLIDADEG